MINQGVNKIGIMAAGGLVVLALASAPASANHGHGIVGPAVAFLAFSALFHHGHRHHYGHSHGHNRPHYKQNRRHSRSHGGYYKPRSKHYKH